MTSMKALGARFRPRKVKSNSGRAGVFRVDLWVADYNAERLQFLQFASGSSYASLINEALGNFLLRKIDEVRSKYNEEVWRDIENGFKQLKQ